MLANARMPTIVGYQRLVDMADDGELPIPWLVSDLRREYARLALPSPDPHEAFDRLRTRRRVGELLLDVARREGPEVGEEDAIAMALELRQMSQAIVRTQREWQR